VLGYLIVRYPLAHARLSADVPAAGPQKFHHAPTPRIGGIPVLLGLAVAAFAVHDGLDSVTDLTTVAVSCSLFAFAGGLAEDFTKRVRVRLRLMLTFISAAFGYFFLDARISGLDVPGLDWALGFTLVSFAFTLFAVGGFAQAMNIVDGFNGLAGVVALIFLAAIAFVARMVGDESIMLGSTVLAGAILGFLIFNFPRGLIFLGDGGAYMIGFLIAEFTVLLVHRNTEVSPWFALTLLSYPIVETMFSIYRKRVLRGQSAGEPDGLHLHMLIFKRLVRRPGARRGVWANSFTSPFLWLLSLVAAVPAVVFWDNTHVLQAATALFIAAYVWIYWRIVRFRTPKVFLLRGIFSKGGRIRQLNEEEVAPALRL
jgi:UDP-N-acetylmuramyl pentapeptide phosphotransferase/UDP-N-acetylglucosamine-1-phosphate transferase